MADISDLGESPQIDDSDIPGLDEAMGSVDPSDEDILKDAQARMSLASEAEREIRQAALDDLNFLSGKQWDDNIEQDRNRDGRPCLTINRLPQLVQQVTNDQRQNRPAIKVHPVGDGAQEETAEIIQGLIRHIEYNSDAEVAYDTAFEAAAEGSFGYFRILSDFVGPDSFDQEILIKLIKNQFSVYFDPFAQEPDGKDAKWCLITEYLSPEDYRAQYPDSELAAANMDWQTVGNRIPGWFKDKTACVAEYFYIFMKDATVHLLSTGITVRDEDLKAQLENAAQNNLQATVVKSRKTKIPEVRWCKLNGIEILDRGVCPGKYIPIIPVYGKDRNLDGKRVLESMIRHSKDPQRMYNYWKSAETETIALAPRAPFIGAEGQFEGHEEEWAMANRRSSAYLEYKPTTIAGQAAPPPQRQTFEPAVQAITQAAMNAADDLKATSGVYDAGVGAESNEVSGAAIQKRATQVQTANFHFIDNMKRSLKHAGRILIDWIPEIYDNARTQRIISDDGTQKMVILNEAHQNEAGETKLYALDVGRYDCTVDTGPSFATKRQEAAASMMDFTRTVPQVAQNIADLIAKNMDWPGAQEISDRLKLLLPPALQQDPTKQQVPPQVQAQMQQMSQMIQQLSQHLNEKSQIIEKKAIETSMKKMELEHDERIELAKIQADVEINLAKLGSQSSIELLRQQIKELMAREKMIGMSVPIGSDDPYANTNSASLGAGGSSAMGAAGMQSPTGGQAPGSPMGPNP